MWPADVLQFSPHCLFYYWWERERLRSAVYHIYSERCEDTREEHHATGNTANLRENILWELSVNTSIQCGFYENISQTVDARLEDDPVWLYPPPPDLHSHAVLADSCTIAVHACVDTLTFWSAGVLTRIGRVVAYSLTLLAWIFPISDCFMCIHIYFHPLGSCWTLTRSSISLFSAGCRGCLVAHAEL